MIWKVKLLLVLVKDIDQASINILLREADLKLEAKNTKRTSKEERKSMKL